MILLDTLNPCSSLIGPFKEPFEVTKCHDPLSSRSLWLDFGGALGTLRTQKPLSVECILTLFRFRATQGLEGLR